MSIKTYNPFAAQDSALWLETDESERIELVLNYHEQCDDDIPEDGKKMHSLIHVVVENQLALGEKYVVNTLSKLERQGLDRHDAIHAIGAVLSAGIYDSLKGTTEEFTVKKYRKRLEKLSAKRWNKGQW